MTVTSTLEERREAALGGLREQRAQLEAALNGIAPADNNVGSEWSALDLLRHLNGRQYPGQVERLLQEENPAFGGGGQLTPEAAWRRTIDQSLAAIDEAIGHAERLTPEQLARKGTRASGAILTVMDVLEAWSAHYDDHLNQLTKEIVPRIPGLRH